MIIKDEDVVKLYNDIMSFCDKVKKDMQSCTSATDLLSGLNVPGERIASHYTGDGFKAWYRCENGQIMSVTVNLNAEKEYEELPDYCKSKE